MAKKTETTRTEARHDAMVAFMLNLSQLDADDLDRGLEKISVEAANLFPMIRDRGVDGNVGSGQSRNESLLDETIYRVEAESETGMPSLSLEHPIVINAKGEIVDGRNRTRSVLKRFGLPKIYWGPTDLDEHDVVQSFRRIVTAKGDAMDMLKQSAGTDDAPEKTWTEADLLFRHLKVVEGDDAALFDQVLRQNMARRDMTTSQRACVAAQVASNKARSKRFGLATTDASVADSFGIGHKTMKRAKALLKGHRDLFDRVMAGELSVGGAEKEAAKRANTASSSEGQSTPKSKKVENVRETVTVAKIDAKGVSAGIADEMNDPADVFNAIIDGLDKRFSKHGDMEQFEALEAVLSRLMGVNLK